ncbi:MAG: O-antigen/teichoic acid export membrane protein [Phenylobacterium sp.]|jgi:O-antigen/teichoic acid export membrane protein
MENNGQIKAKVINNSFWLLLERMVTMASALVLSILFARELGPEGFGRLSYVQSFAALLTPVFALGMSRILLREFGKTPQQIPSIIRTCRDSRLVSGVVVTLLTGAGLYFFQDASWKLQLITVLLIGNISNAFEVYDLWFVHQSNNKLMVLWRISCITVFALLKGLALWLSQQVWLLIVVMAIEAVVRNTGYQWFYKHRFNDEKAQPARFEPEIFTDIFSQSRYLIASALAAVVYLQIDILMLEQLSDSAEVGIYAVAAKLSSVWYFFPQVILTALFPMLLKIAHDTPHRYRELLQQGFDALFICALTLSLLVYAFGPWVINVMFGEAYNDSIPVLTLHIFSTVFVYMRALLSFWLVSERFAEFSLFSQVSGAISNILLNLMLIPLYGAWGAAVATLISYGISTYFCLFCFARTRSIAMMMTKSMLFVFRLREIVVGWRQLLVGKST